MQSARDEEPFNPDKIWEAFYIKFPRSSPESNKHQEKYKRKLDAKEIEQFNQYLQRREDKGFLSANVASQRIQQYWRKRREQDNLNHYNQILLLDDDKIINKNNCDEKTIYLQKEKNSCLIAFSFKNGKKKIKKIKDNSTVILLKEFERYNCFKKNLFNVEAFDQLLSLCGYSDLFPVNPKGNHRTEFDEFLHHQLILKSIDEKKLKRLLTALQEGLWNDDIFDDPHLTQLAVSLFESSEITQQQAITILERAQTFKDHEHIKTIFILDEKGNFTEDAKKILIPSLFGKYLTELNSEQLDELRLLISRLPKSEQIFYITNGNKYKNEYKALLSRDQKIPSLGSLLINLEGMYHHIENEVYNLIHVSAAVRDALGITRFGLDNYVRMVPTLGEKTPKEIEEGIRRSIRWGAISGLRTQPFKNIHDYKNPTNTEATAHDYYHSKVMSTFKKEMQIGFLYLVEAVREVTQSDLKSEWSKEIWDWVDCEFTLLFRHHKDMDAEAIRKKTLSVAAITKLFCDALLFGGKSLSVNIRNYILPKRYSQAENFNDFTDLDERNITPVGIIFILDIIKNKKKWKENKIDFDTLPGNHPIKKWYHEIQKLYAIIKDDDPKIQIFKVFLYQNLKMKYKGERYQDGGKDQFKFMKKCISEDESFNDQKLESQFKVLSQLISASKLINSKLKFKKITKKDVTDFELSLLEQNTIYLSFDDMKMNIHPEKNDKLFNKVVEKIAREYIGHSPIDIANFRTAILDLNYDFESAIQYVKNKNIKDEDKSSSFHISRLLINKNGIVEPFSLPKDDIFISEPPVIHEEIDNLDSPSKKLKGLRSETICTDEATEIEFDKSHNENSMHSRSKKK